jgi:hypothetical protein
MTQVYSKEIISPRLEMSWASPVPSLFLPYFPAAYNYGRNRLGTGLAQDISNLGEMISLL